MFSEYTMSERLVELLCILITIIAVAYWTQRSNTNSHISNDLHRTYLVLDIIEDICCDKSTRATQVSSNVIVFKVDSKHCKDLIKELERECKYE